jgi:alpha-1,3-mannosyltransferase
MDILQVVRQYLPGTGGMETYVASLCRQLSLRGHRADVATLDRLFKTNWQLPPHEQIDGIEVIRFPAGGNARYFFAPRLLEALPRYDLIHIHGVDFFVDMLGTLRRIHGKPLVLTTHGGYFHTRWLPWFKRAFFNTVTRNSLKGVDRVIASSTADAEIFSQITDNLTLVENGIDFNVYSGIRRKPEDETLLFVGRLSKNKRIDLLLSAFGLVLKQRPGAKLLIVGPDWEGLKDGLEQTARKLHLEDAVTFTGRIPQTELLAALGKAKLFVSASEYEAFGLSTVEAMAAGLIPVVNNIPANAGLIRQGEDGFLVDFTDSTEAAAAIDTALGMDGEIYSKMSQAATQSASKHDWNIVVGQIIDVYQHVLSGARVG